MLHSLVGLQNSGKTLYLTLKGFQAWAKGKLIITNYPVKYPHVLVNLDWIINLVKSGTNIPNACYLLDEFWLWCDSRGSGSSSVNKILSYFYLQSSKDGSDVYITAQGNDQNDRRFRKNTNKITTCNRAVFMDGEMVDLDEEERFLPEEVLPLLYIHCVEYKQRVMGMYTELVKDKEFYIPAQPVFGLYDTTNKIKAKV